MTAFVIILAALIALEWMPDDMFFKFVPLAAVLAFVWYLPLVALGLAALYFAVPMGFRAFCAIERRLDRIRAPRETQGKWHSGVD